MAINHTHIFKVGQKVFYYRNEFDMIKPEFEPYVVKETFDDHIILKSLKDGLEIWAEDGFNLDKVYPDYNMPIILKGGTL